MTHKQQESRNRKILDMSLLDSWPNRKRDLRELYALLQKQGWSVTSYKGVLTDAVKHVERSMLAINALDAPNA